MDKDRDGKISPLELRQALLQGGVPVPAEAQFQAMFSATDMDKNGYIDYIEFVAVMLESSSVAQWVSVLALLLLSVSCWRALLWHRRCTLPAQHTVMCLVMQDMHGVKQQRTACDAHCV